MKKAAFIVDWENVRKGVFEYASRKLKHRVNYNEPRNVLKLLMSFLEKDEEIYRIFLYLSEPLELHEDHELYNPRAYQAAVRFIRTMSVQDYVAIRKGKLKIKRDPRGIATMVQKQVDMLMGLDIAHLSYNRLVDRVIVFSWDTDIIPALKVARFQGLQVVLPVFDDITPENIREEALIELQEHVDFTRHRAFADIFSRDS